MGQSIGPSLLGRSRLEDEIDKTLLEEQTNSAGWIGPWTPSAITVPLTFNPILGAFCVLFLDTRRNNQKSSNRT